jgi:hypothetical protein
MKQMSEYEPVQFVKSLTALSCISGALCVTPLHNNARSQLEIVTITAPVRRDAGDTAPLPPLHNGTNVYLLVVLSSH